MMLKERAKLSEKTSSAILAVSDLDRARRFYAETLGLEPAGDMEEVLSFRTGSTTFMIYTSQFAGTNKANALVWDAGSDFDTIVAELRERDISFEEYPDMGMEIADGVHSSGDFKAVWFKDPDGNILHVNSM